MMDGYDALERAAGRERDGDTENGCQKPVLLTTIQISSNCRKLNSGHSGKLHT